MNLSAFFTENPDVAIAFSGGTDSAYLLYAAMRWGRRVRAYYVKSAFQPQFEWEDARKIAVFLGADMVALEADILSCPAVVENGPERCYYCKKELFSLILRRAAEDGFSLLADGTNASDSAQDRPGMRALQELHVRSPLRECGLTKPDIRRLSQEAGLFTWWKPAYACLATRIPTGDVITEEKLSRTEWAEQYLFSLGFHDFRIRLINGAARIQIPADQLPMMLEKRAVVFEALAREYDGVLLDLEARHV